MTVPPICAFTVFAGSVFGSLTDTLGSFVDVCVSAAAVADADGAGSLEAAVGGADAVTAGVADGAAELAVFSGSFFSSQAARRTSIEAAIAAVFVMGTAA